MNKLTVTFDKSNEDIPVLVVSSESLSFFGPSTTKVENILSGEVAISVWDLLNGKKKSIDDILGTRTNTMSPNEVEMMLDNLYMSQNEVKTMLNNEKSEDYKNGES